MPKDDKDWYKLLNILNSNQEKNFIQRILKPDVNPVLSLGPKEYGTHMMSSAEVDGKNIVYPEIIQMPDGNLKRLGRDEAIDYALKNKEFIEFDNPADALWFGKNYKKVWGW